MTLCVVTGCLRYTPIDHLQILSDIQPADFRRLGATHVLPNDATLDPKDMIIPRLDLESVKTSDPLSTLLINIHDSFFYYKQHCCYCCKLIPHHFALVQSYYLYYH